MADVDLKVLAGDLTVLKVLLRTFKHMDESVKLGKRIAGDPGRVRWLRAWSPTKVGRFCGKNLSWAFRRLQRLVGQGLVYQLSGGRYSISIPGVVWWTANRHRLRYAVCGRRA